MNFSFVGVVRVRGGIRREVGRRVYLEEFVEKFFVGIGIVRD